MLKLSTEKQSRWLVPTEQQKVRRLKETKVEEEEDDDR